MTTHSLLLWFVVAMALAVPAGADPIRIVRDCYSIGMVESDTHLLVDGLDVCSQAPCRVCTPTLGIHVLETVRPSGQTSGEPLEIERVADLDCDGDRLIGQYDFGCFTGRFGECTKPNGAVVECGSP
jgi:hypothetical protein